MTYSWKIVIHWLQKQNISRNKKLLRKLLKSPMARSALTWSAAQYIRFVRLTGRWRTIGEEIPDELQNSGQPFIAAFWHGRLIMMAFSWKRSNLVNMLISGHRDGQLVSEMMAHFGSQTVFGSSTRGGAAAFIQMARLLRAGKVVGLTPDGPNGPRMRANLGVVALAKLSGVPILPLTFSTSSGHLFKSWDRFLLPFPFGRGIFLWGEPIFVPKSANEELMRDKRAELEHALLVLTQRADWLMNCRDVEPSPAITETGL